MPAPTTGKPGMGGPPPPGGGYHQPPPYGSQPHFQQPPYGGPPPPNGQFPPNGGGYMGWQGQQQQQPPPPQGYGGGPGPGWQGQAPPMGMYRQGGPPPPNGMDRGNWNGGYRGGPPPQQGRRPPPSVDQHSPPRQGSGGKPEGGPYWGQQQQQQQQWPQHQWQGGPPGPPPPHGWQGGPPPIQQPGPSPPPNMPQHMQGPPKIWGRNGMTSPVRGGGPRRSPDIMPGMMNGYPARMNGMDSICKPIDGDQDMYMSRDDKGGKNSMAHDKDKGRGSYRCGRCGAPKKGHVCPYQPKLKRRPDEPPPEMRNAAIQVEMDEFMTVRRLNIEIQGFPESYATAPLMADNMVVGEPHPLAVSAGVVTNLETPPISSPPPETPDVMRSSPGPSPVVETGA